MRRIAIVVLGKDQCDVNFALSLAIFPTNIQKKRTVADSPFF